MIGLVQRCVAISAIAELMLHLVTVTWLISDLNSDSHRSWSAQYEHCWLINHFTNILGNYTKVYWFIFLLENLNSNAIMMLSCCDVKPTFWPSAVNNGRHGLTSAEKETLYFQFIMYCDVWPLDVGNICDEVKISCTHQSVLKSTFICQWAI